MHPSPARARIPFLPASLGLAILLAGCGKAPANADNAAADMVNATNAAANEANEVANDAVANVAAHNGAAPAPANVAEASPAPAASPTPAAAAPLVANAGPAGDAANGEKLFVQCRVCHSVEPDRNGLGPSLHGVVGRHAAALTGFVYSPAMKDSGLSWDAATLSDYLRAPMRKVPGTKMAFAGIADDQNRADLIAYLATLK